MKKLLIGLFASLSISSFAAATTSVVISTASMSNMLGTATGSALVTQIILTAPANNTASIKLIDSVTNILAYTNSAYATIGSYATNYITSYTNFFGSVNSFTNIALVDYSNYVAAATVNYPTMVTLTAATNSSIVMSAQQLYFNNGIWATNLGSGNATLTLNYSKP